MAWKAYLRIIFPLANILCERREHERRDTAAGWKKQLNFFAAKKLTYSAIWWRQTGTQFPTLHHPDPQCAPLHSNLLMTQTNTINQHFIRVIFQNISHQEAGRTALLWIIWLLYESYLSIVLKHLIALHVVTLEHDDRSVEAGDIQTEVICPNFFIRRVWEYLETRCLSQKMKQRHYSLLHIPEIIMLKRAVDERLCEYLFLILFWFTVSFVILWCQTSFRLGLCI